MKYFNLKLINKYLFLFVSLNFANAQELPEVVPQTPEAAALSKYSEYPIGSFTGIPSISVPLYTINSGDIAIPIGLNYHAGGFKVNEEASWVGLGWTLSLNYTITRSIKGKDDFTGAGNGEGNYAPYHSIGTQPNNGTTPWIVDINSYNGFEGGSEAIPSFDLNMGSNTDAMVDGTVFNYHNYAPYRFDWEPDIYSINLPGLNAKFVLDQQQNVYFIEKQDVEINKIANGWSARTNDGFQYFFEQKETTENFYNSELSGTWYITKIISPTGREMDFFYDEDTEFNWLPSYSETAIKTGGGDYIQNPNFLIEPRFSYTKYKRVYLNRVEFDNGHVDLVRSNSLREDLKNGERLESIQIYNLNNKLIKEFEFMTSYFDSGSNQRGYFDEGFMDNSDYSFYTKRLKLDGIVEKNGLLSKTHKFNYSSVNLPNKDSFSMDHWGYFNAATNDQLIPDFEGDLIFKDYYEGFCYYDFDPGDNLNNSYTCGYNTVDAIRYDYARYFGSDRETNPNTVGANILTEIIYPTGGKTSFEFEANNYSNFESPEYEYINYTEDVRKVAAAGQVTTYESTTFPIDFSEDIISVEDTSVNFGVYASGANPNGMSLTSNMWFDFTADTNDTSNINNRYYFDQYANGSQSGFNATDYLSDNITGNINLSIEMPVSSNSDEHKTAYITFNCRLKQRVYDVKPAGGLRIKRISHKEAENSTEIVKTYKYDYEFTNTSNGQTYDASYGKLKVPVKYWSIGLPNPNSTKAIFSSSTYYQLSLNQNSHIGYSKVIEEIGENGENGKVVYDYHNHTNMNFDYVDWIAGVPNSTSIPLDGKLERKEVFNGQNSMVSEESYSYSTDQEIVKAIYLDYFDPNCYENCPGAEIRYVKSRMFYYPIFSRWEPMTLKRQKIYNSSNNSYLETVTNYAYNPDNLQLATTTTIESKGDVIRTENYYPNDLTSSNYTSLLGDPLTSAEYEAIDQLKRTKDDGFSGDHKSASVIQVDNYVNDVLTTRVRTNYSNGWGNGQTLPGNVESAKASSGLEERITYQSYDSYGNPVEIFKTNGAHIYYIWGYNGQYPIAKIENLDSNDIDSGLQNLITTATVASNADDDRTSDIVDQIGVVTYVGNEGSLREALNNIRNALSNGALMTSYTYDPLIGVTSITDPRGYTIYYEYDAFNRLEEVRDADNNIVTDYQYHYKN
ncbi:RHS repeat domain-containing protein [Croceivirga radicis]|uniref:RHS repeat domain-containing protein n=1 Tax=Croceivirga radicis TaxID=1929488 RepID=UPI000255B310|nr:RHS repeat domain-containing protein [Croceivirga radicis]